MNKIYANPALDNKILKDFIEKTLEPQVKKELDADIVENMVKAFLGRAN